MNMQKSSGFTIIEVTLFFAISAVLAVALLTGWTVLINTQRYRDSVSTVQGFLQQQYNLVYNVENGRPNSLGCDSGGVRDTGPSDARGQSLQCIIMGRYIRITNGDNIEVFGIVGRDNVNDVTASDNAAILGRAPSRVSSTLPLGFTANKLAIPWGAQVVNGGGGSTPQNIAIAIVRAPLTGTVHTYTQILPNATDMPNVVDMVALANEREALQLCLNPGSTFSGGRMGVSIKKVASTQSSVEILSDKDDTC